MCSRPSRKQIWFYPKECFRSSVYKDGLCIYLWELRCLCANAQCFCTSVECKFPNFQTCWNPLIINGLAFQMIPQNVWTSTMEEVGSLSTCAHTYTLVLNVWDMKNEYWKYTIINGWKKVPVHYLDLKDTFSLCGLWKQQTNFKCNLAFETTHGH